jgi:hypothetical protein
MKEGVSKPAPDYSIISRNSLIGKAPGTLNRGIAVRIGFVARIIICFRSCLRMGAVYKT